ncbi:MAG: hypothetical protein KDA25_03865 [Phycisphaerales bacterium]|nr:hypothetical protein [Phycisphaerales bacterium]
MTSGDIRHWAYLIGGLLFLSLCIWTVWWSLFGDRAKSRRRCPSCWYDMSGSPSLRCSECGHVAARERDLRRTRRRWFTGAFTAVAVSLLVTVQVHDLSTNGIAAAMPTSVLILALPWEQSANGAAGVEIMRRHMRGEVSQDQWRSIARRCLRGDSTAAPASDAWMQRYEPFIDLIPDTVTKETAIRDGLLDLPAAFRLTTRGAWPADVDPWVRLRMMNWWPDEFDVRLEIEPVVDGASPIVVYHDGSGGPRGFPFEITGLASDASSVDVSVTCQRRERGRRDAWVTITAQTITVPIGRGPPLAETMVPLERGTPLLASAHVFDAGIYAWSGGPSPVRFRFRIANTFRSEFDDTAIGASMELRHGDRLARRLNIWWRAGTDARDDGYGFEIAHEDAALLETFDASDPQWTLTVSGGATLAARAPAARRYWEGTLDLPLTDVPVTTDPGRSVPHEWSRDDGDRRADEG